MNAIFSSSSVVSYLKDSKTSFLLEVDSRIAGGALRQHNRVIDQVQAILARPGGPELVSCNAALSEGYRFAKAERAALRSAVIKKEMERIRAAWPLKVSLPVEKTTEQAENELLRQMEQAVLYIMYPKGYFLTSIPCVTAPKDAERRALAQRIYSFVVDATKDLLLQGVDNGRIFLSDVMSAIGKKIDIKDVKRACSDVHGAVVDEIANCQQRSGKCWLDIRYSDSIKKGMGISWEIHNYE